jgi:hypothetical protein
MPADKYGFAPTDGEFKGVRTFGQQVKHLAATNHILAAAALGEHTPADAGGEFVLKFSNPNFERFRHDLLCTGAYTIIFCCFRMQGTSIRRWSDSLRLSDAQVLRYSSYRLSRNPGSFRADSIFFLTITGRVPDIHSPQPVS